MDESKEIVSRYNDLKSSRVQWDQVWEEIAHYISPIRSHILEGSNASAVSNLDQPYDSTAIRANAVLSSGQFNFSTPIGERWLSFEPHGNLNASNDEVIRWHQGVTDVVMETLSKSNFYQHKFQVDTDKSAFGTALMFCGEDSAGDVFFRTYPIGTYCLQEDYRGRIDTVFREFDLTNRQAVQQWGLDALPKVVKDQLSKSSQMDVKRNYLHYVCPADTSSNNSKSDKPYKSYYIDIQSHHIVSYGGYDEFPYFVSRYMRWGNEVYGYSPSMEALPDIRQVNTIEKTLDLLSEKQCFPPVLVPSDYDGDIDFNANGITYYDPLKPNAIPREWLTGGNYNIGIDRLNSKKEAINDAFHVNLFKLISNRGKTMSATEVAELSNEKLLNFSPAASRVFDEFLSPLLLRVFKILYRNNRFESIPRSYIFPNETEASFTTPKISFSSRLSLAYNSIKASATNSFVSSVANFSQLEPSALDVLNMDEVIKVTSKAMGVPSEVIRSDEELESIRNSRSEQLAQAKAMEALQSGSEVVKNTGLSIKELLNQNEQQ